MFPRSNNAYYTVGVKSVCGMNMLIATILWGRTGLSSPHHHWNYTSVASWKSSDPEKSYLATKFAFPQVPPDPSSLPLRAKSLLCRSHPWVGFLWSPQTWMGKLIKARRIERRYYLGAQRSCNQFLFILHLEKLRLRPCSGWFIEVILFNPGEKIIHFFYIRKLRL